MSYRVCDFYTICKWACNILVDVFLKRCAKYSTISVHFIPTGFETRSTVILKPMIIMYSTVQLDSTILFRSLNPIFKITTIC